jgi:hypothetical protein
MSRRQKYLVPGLDPQLAQGTADAAGPDDADPERGSVRATGIDRNQKCTQHQAARDDTQECSPAVRNVFVDSHKIAPDTPTPAAT